MRFLLRLFLLACVVAGAAYFWLGPEALRPTAVTELEPRQQPTEALAETADAKLQELRSGRQHRVALGEAELESLVRYRYAGLLPAFVDDPRIELEPDRVRITGRVPSERVPRVEELGRALALMPDTVDIEMAGRIYPLDDRAAALDVEDIRIAKLPVPQRLIRPLLDRLGRSDRPGLDPHAIPLPLPPGVAAVYVRADSLVLTRSGNADSGGP